MATFFRSKVLKDVGIVKTPGIACDASTRSTIIGVSLTNLTQSNIFVNKQDNKEIVKVLVTASLDEASIIIYARNNLGTNLVDITATVNNSYVDITLNPTASKEGSKVIYTVQYYQNQNPQVV